MLDFDTLQSAFKNARAGFVKAEIELGLTFSQMAIDTRDSEKRRRCTYLAREAHDTAEKFLSEIPHEDLYDVMPLKPLLIRLRGKIELLALTP